MLSDGDFSYISREIKNRSGLVLTPDKAYLLETRLASLMRKENVATLSEFISLVRARCDEKLLWRITDALTTNETFFFRDKTPFDLLRERIAPDLARAKRGAKIRLWCAACSTGQEPYSIAMLFDELRSSGRGLDIEIVATDISDRVLEKARAGLYSQFEVQRGLPIQLLMKNFEKTGDLWRISDRIRAMVRYQRANLLEDISALGRFDVVFCRNVLIYFDQEAKRRTLEKIAAVMAPDGYLLLGAAETVLGVTDAFHHTAENRGLYQRNASWQKAA
jgi:chemotaxis protein methyltransferase CheR